MATFAPPPTAIAAAPGPSYRRLPPLSATASLSPHRISAYLRFSSPAAHHSLLAARPRLSAEHSRVRAVVEEESASVEEANEEEVRAGAEEEEEESGSSEEASVEEAKASAEAKEGDGGGKEVMKQQVRPCELYICNLPRSHGATELLELFRPFGTVVSVEVSTNSETGISKGCGFVSMSSILEAKAAMSSLDGSDLEGREIRVKYSADMVPQRNSIGARKPNIKRNVIESPHKVYAGNLSWSVTSDDLREHFSQFGTVISIRVLHDRKEGKNRVYAFLSFSTADELQAALSLNETKFLGRRMMVRQVAEN